MTPHYLPHNRTARRPDRAASARLHATGRPALSRSLTTGVLCALVGLASPLLVAPIAASASPSGVALFAPGSIVVSQGGTIAAGEGGTAGTVAADGEVNVYPPNSHGDVRPLASFTKGMNGPFTVRFDPSGDLWAANVNNNTLVEFTSAQLATPDPSPAVTISLALGTGSPPIWLSTARATSGSSTITPPSGAKSTSTPTGNWPALALRRLLPLFLTSRASLVASVLTPLATCGYRPKPPPSALRRAWSSSPRTSWARRTRRPRSSSLRQVAPTFPSRPRVTCGWSPGAARRRTH